MRWSRTARRSRSTPEGPGPAQERAPAKTGPDAAARIAELDDWRGKMLGRVRELIHAALPDVVEAWKWRGVPVWEQDGIPCTGESYRDKIKLTFARGAPPCPTPRGCSTPASTATPAAIDLD